MSVTEFWDGEPSLAVAYRKAEELRQKKKNEEAWLNGLYVYRAICSVASYFSQDKNSHIDYPAKPLEPDNQEDEENKKAEAEARAEVWMRSWVSAMQERFKSEPEPLS